jgi:hypothetical protein
LPSFAAETPAPGWVNSVFNAVKAAFVGAETKGPKADKAVY